MRPLVLRRLLKRLLAAAISVWLMPGLGWPAQAAPPIVDSFERADIDEAIWSLAQVRPSRLRIERGQARNGDRALALRVEAEDRDCGGRCQRNEIRIANHLRLRF